jgi:hypothetical protein
MFEPEKSGNPALTSELRRSRLPERDGDPGDGVIVWAALEPIF